MRRAVWLALQPNNTVYVTWDKPELKDDGFWIDDEQHEFLVISNDFGLTPSYPLCQASIEILSLWRGVRCYESDFQRDSRTSTKQQTSSRSTPRAFYERRTPLTPQGGK